MGYRIIRTDHFQQDLDSAVGYIVLSLENRAAAKSLLDAVEECYETLESMPLMYEACHDPFLREKGYRRAIIKNYIMVYEVDEQDKTVTVLRFFHGKRDYEKMI